MDRKISLQEKLDQEVKRAEQKAEDLKKILEIYPDLEDTGRTRWETNLLISDLAKKDMIDCSFKHSCGCCPDAALLARPYIEINGYTIWTKQIEYYIGEKNEFGYGEIERDNWMDVLRKDGLREEIIDLVVDFFNQNLPSDYSGEEDLY